MPDKNTLEGKEKVKSDVEFKCSGCGADLTFRGENRVVRCEYCGKENVVPDELWNKLHPPVKVQPLINYVDISLPEPAAPQTRSKLLAPVIIILIVLAISIFIQHLVRRKISGGFTGGSVEQVNKPRDIAVPSIEKADVTATIKNMIEVGKKLWKKDLVIGSVLVTNMNAADGTVNLSESGPATIIIELFDTEKLSQMTSFQDSVPFANYKLIANQNGLFSSIGDAFRLDVSQKFPMHSFPECSVKSLVQNAQKAGYPGEGFVNLTFPEIPDELKMKLGDEVFPSFLKEEDSLVPGIPKTNIEKSIPRVARNRKKEIIQQRAKEKGEEWFEKTVYCYDFVYLGPKSVNLPQYFRFTDCSPAKEEVIVTELLGNSEGEGESMIINMESYENSKSNIKTPRRKSSRSGKQR